MRKLTQSLMAVGFGEYEARTYATLLTLGQATGYQIAKESGVPRSAVYEVLTKLVTRGVVLTQAFADQVRYAPLPPERFLHQMRREFDTSVDTLADALKGLVVTTGTPGTTWSLTGRRNILAYARQLIEQAAREVLLLVGDDDELDELRLVLEGAHARGCTVLVVTPTPYAMAGVPVRVHSAGQALRQTLGHGLTLVVDQREALLGETDHSETAVWTTNRYTLAWARWSLHQEAAQAGGPLPRRKATRRR
jgi:predicted transcriptional regulator